MSGPENASLWTPEAVLNDPEWVDLRRLARMAVESLGWEVEPPLHYGRALADFAWREELPELPIPEARS